MIIYVLPFKQCGSSVAIKKNLSKSQCHSIQKIYTRTFPQCFLVLSQTSILTPGNCKSNPTNPAESALPSFSNFLARCSKRRTIENMKKSHTVEQLLNLVGRGRIDVSCATDVARAILDDGVQHESINKVASLGCYGSSQSNAERDLHRWLKNHFGLCLQPYTIHLPLKATNGINLMMCGFFVDRWKDGSI